MQAHLAPPPIADLDRSPSFTLGTALVLLGHDCCGTCPTIATRHRAKVWFLHLPRGTDTTWTVTLVEVEFDENPWAKSRRRSLLSEVNRCVHSDHIRVRERSAAERGIFITALNARSAARS